MKNTKQQKKRLFLLYSTVGIILLALLFFKVIPDLQEDSTSSCRWEESYIMKVNLYPFDWEYIDYKVNDFYIDEKRVSEFYWSKLCRDLLKVRLNETLSKSENLWLDIDWIWFEEHDIELLCDYDIYWGEEGDFYGRSIEYGKEYFSTEELLLAQEKRPLRYNESRVTVTWREELQQTRLMNDNPDYYIVLKLKLNESIEVCG